MQPDIQYDPPVDKLNSPWTPQILLPLLDPPLPTQRKSRRRGNKILVGKVVKEKIVELEEEVREGC